MSNVQRSWWILLSLIGSYAADPELVYAQKGLSNIFICPYKSTLTNSVLWSFLNNTIFPLPISDGTVILPLNSPHPRASVVGDHTAGVYNLNMSGLQESDEGVYRCTVGANQQKEYKLELLAAPSSLTLQHVITDNKILGTEGQNLTLRCTAIGGKPPPLVSITVDNVLRSTEQTVEYTIPTLERRHNGQRIYCQANSSALIYPLVATAALYLNYCILLSSSEAVIGGVSGGLSAVIVILIIIILVLILRKQGTGKQRSTAQTSRWKDETSYHNYIDCKETDEQEDTQAETDKLKSRSAQEYESLGMKDNPSTYSELLTKQDTNKTRSAPEYETLGTTDNPDTYLELHDEQGQKQSENNTDLYESLSDQDKSTVCPKTKAQLGPAHSEYTNIKM